MADWFNFGTTAFGSLSGQPYERIYAFPDAPQIALSYRFGSESALASHVGKVIRAIDAAGDFDRMWVDVSPIVTVYAGRGATRQPFAFPVTLQIARPNNQPNNKWEVNVPDTTIPLGLLRAGAGGINTNQWAGLSTSSFVVLHESDAGGRRPNIARARYLLSPKPRWLANTPTALVEGDTSNRFEVLIQYPDGTPVAGLQLMVYSSDQKVVFGTGSAYSVLALTDSSGRISLPVRAIAGGADAINLRLVDTRCDIDYFDPPLTGVYPINAQATTVGGRSCVVLPARPEVQYKPEVRTESMSLAWNAGAYSQLELDGDCEIVITDQQAVIGAVLGFVRGIEDDVTNYALKSHGFYFSTTQTGRLQYQVMESGKAIGPMRTHAGEVLRVQRIGTMVRYLSGDTITHTSRVPLTGPLRVGCSLFASGDSI